MQVTFESDRKGIDFTNPRLPRFEEMGLKNANTLCMKDIALLHKELWSALVAYVRTGNSILEFGDVKAEIVRMQCIREDISYASVVKNCWLCAAFFYQTKCRECPINRGQECVCPLFRKLHDSTCKRDIVYYATKILEQGQRV